MPSSRDAISRKINAETISVIEVIIGVAISAGSTPTLLAPIGSRPPITFANIITRTIDIATVRPIITV